MSDRYGEAGADLETGYEPVRLIKGHVVRTKVRGAVGSVDAFGGASDLSVLNMKEPALVNRTDGVGTKLLVAFEMDKHDTVGIDAVAMYVNDALAQGAVPIFFLDYLVVGKNEPKRIEQLVKGVADGCVQAECTLVDGETTEMPDIYDVEHYGIASSCVGAVGKCNLLDGQKVEKGNTPIGLPSTGVHSNGFSLIHKVLLKDAKLDLHKECEEIRNQKLGGILLTPTKIYVRAIKHLLGKVDIKGMSHITGGDFYESVPRVLKEGRGVTIDTIAHPRKPISDMIAKYGNIPMGEVCSVFNVDTGFTMAADKENVDTIQSPLKEIHEESYVVGEVTSNGSVDVKWQTL